MKTDLHSDSIDSKVDSFEIATKLRQQVSKWQKAQSDTYLRELKEHEHFEIKIHQSAQTGDPSVSVTVICSICNKSIPIKAQEHTFYLIGLAMPKSADLRGKVVKLPSISFYQLLSNKQPFLETT